jgi:hypothetical protein
MGTYRWKVRFCKSWETGVEEVLQEKMLLQERRIAGGAKRGKRFSSSSENGLLKYLMGEYTAT